MKLLVVLSACLLVASSQTAAQPVDGTAQESFTKLVANHTAFLLSREEHSTNLQTCYYKLLAMDRAAERFHIELPAHRVLNELGFTATSIFTPERMLLNIQEIQKVLLDQFKRFNAEREPVATSSEVNKIIDGFLDEISESASEVFEGMYAEAVNVAKETEEISAKLLGLLDELAEKMDECLQIPTNAFRKIFQCHADSKQVVERMTPDITKLSNISEKLRSDFWAQWSALDSEIETKAKEAEEAISKLKQAKY